MPTEPDPARALFRHTLATLAYRGGKAIRDAGPEFPTFRAADKTRTPVEILAHIGDLLTWALSIAKGQEKWIPQEVQSWEKETKRFFNCLQEFDDFLASDEPMACAPERLFQAPIADAFTHVGQIAMLRRLAGSAMRGENYFKADIVSGRVGPEQSPPGREFD